MLNAPEANGDWAKRYRAAQKRNEPLRKSDLHDLVDRHLSLWRDTSPFVGHTDSASAPQYASALTEANLPGGAERSAASAAAKAGFRRLCFIQQLSTTSFSIHGDAGHTRYAHTRGVLALTTRHLGVLIQRGTVIHLNRLKAVLLYALLHDYFHGPLGHTIDDFREVLLIQGRADKDILFNRLTELLQLIEDSDEHNEIGSNAIWDIARGMCATAMETRDVLREFRALVDPGPYGVKDPLASIVDGPIDADRLDFVWRDALHLGVADALTPTEIDRLIQGVRIVDNKLAYDVDTMDIAERLLRCRRRLYLAFYDAPAKRIIDEMVCAALYLALESENLLEAGLLTDKGLANKLLTLTDQALVQLLQEVCARPNQVLANALLSDVLRGRPFREVLRQGVPIGLLKEIAERKTELRAKVVFTLEPFRAQLSDIERGNPLPEAARRSILGKLTEVFSAPPPQPGEPPLTVEESRLSQAVALIYLQQQFGGKYLRKRLLEKLLWFALQERKDEGRLRIRWIGLLRQLAEALAKSSGHDGEVSAATLFEEIRERPLALLSLSWISSGDSTSLLRHSKGTADGDSVFHREGKVTATNLELRLRASEEDYHVIVSAPGALVPDEEMIGYVKTTFEKVNESYTWVLLAELDMKAADADVQLRALAARLW